ncbi:MAG TPA: KpsF/GutQ family sugar-phosphate isomerase [Chromatiaceae bacterium]|jgi:arabinose-5-phosphate isomerase|nr:KpsF/GutQ family sugar-phosphate isomerase [Chromatiaceae bacterium]HIB83360.1 KpsF/GutQ family sugar-phosphate isomerase [Chromatiaceae bacterium]HIN83017.1 KpsF/GutQ family sugar-phosphate isomerase [Chromatiales bacterium]HIO15040.1 KpsF/GutQ family sugar-phosphate isomerase [Chromatiales bacterium]HIO54359.1 KpsF/GutQ family sugar-phosphate isomerase [Chromatiales bacterium]
MNNIQTDKLLELGRAVLETEAEAVSALLSRVDANFALACGYLLECEGRIVVTGMGKSGHIGSKIAATLASTGSPSFFVHPGEASHGDLGMITDKDVVVAISNSGETGEILAILPLIKRLGIPFISLTGDPASRMAREATVNIDVSVEKEACPLGLAPTASTTAALAMGDAMAISLLEHRGFTEEDFARSHPGGSLGRRLLLLISDIMHTGTGIPIVGEQALLRDALVEVTHKGLGMTAVADADNKMLGIFTDGDLRRVLDAAIDIHHTQVGAVMTRNCKTGRANMLAAEGLKLMQEHKINALLIVDDDDHLVGALNMHDLLLAGVL